MQVEKSGVLKLFPTYVWATQLGAATYEPINRAVISLLDRIKEQDPELDTSGQ